MSSPVRRWLFVVVLLLGVAAGSQFQIAKITLKEPGGSRTVFRVSLPGQEPNAFEITDGDFMCHLYDWYGLRPLGGYGRSTQ